MNGYVCVQVHGRCGTEGAFLFQVLRESLLGPDASLEEYPYPKEVEVVDNYEVHTPQLFILSSGDGNMLFTGYEDTRPSMLDGVREFPQKPLPATGTWGYVYRCARAPLSLPQDALPETSSGACKWVRRC